MQKRRPLPGPFPTDQILTYELTDYQRKITCNGKLTVNTGVAYEGRFEVQEESADSTHQGASHPRLTIPPDPLNIVSLEELKDRAAGGVATEIVKTLKRQLAAESQETQLTAQRHAVRGEVAEAEEDYLRLLAMGLDPDADMNRFFEQRYGMDVTHVIYTLAVGLERLDKNQSADAALRQGQLFPKRLANAKVEAEVEVSPIVTEAVGQGVTEVPVEKQADAPTMSNEELEALERSSLGEEEPKQE